MSSAKTQRGMNSRPDIFIFLGPRQTSSRSKMKPALVMTHISITGSRITMLGLFLALDSQPASFLLWIGPYCVPSAKYFRLEVHQMRKKLPAISY